MIWLTDEERERNARERPAREARAAKKYEELRQAAKKCVACGSNRVNLSGMYSSESAVTLHTKAICAECDCEWYPGKVL